MRSDIKVGIRVWIGWAPDDQVHQDLRSVRGKTGVVVSGPYPPGSLVESSSGEYTCMDDRCWEVVLDIRVDGVVGGLFVVDHLLTPIDGDDLREDLEATKSIPGEL